MRTSIQAARRPLRDPLSACPCYSRARGTSDPDPRTSTCRFFPTRTMGAGNVAYRIEAFDRCNESRYTLVLNGDAQADRRRCGQLL